MIVSGSVQINSICPSFSKFLYPSILESVSLLDLSLLQPMRTPPMHAKSTRMRNFKITYFNEISSVVI